MRRRLCQRFTKRLEVTFTSGGLRYRGISSDLSAGGLFIRTQNGLTPGSLVDIEIFLPEGKTGTLKGVVRRTVKTPLTMVKNGMGIELIERDHNFLEFLKNFDLDDKNPEDGGHHARTASARDHSTSEKKVGEAPQHAESVIISCGSCNVKNKVPRGRLQLGPKCGKCGTLLDTSNLA